MNVLRDMALFVEVCKTMSFRRAAEILDMPSSTLSRRISHLEKQIGLRLLHRTTRKVELTEIGQIYYQRCKHIVDESALAHEELGNISSQVTGVIRLSVPVDFSTIYLSELLTAFLALYPNIRFELDVTPRRADLVSENIDVAIRIGESPDSHLIARKLTQFHAKLFASSTYLQQNGYPKHPTELIYHNCISFLKENLWTLYNHIEQVGIECSGKFKVNNVGMMKRLAALDQGIIFIPESAIYEELANKLLVPILPEWVGKPLSVYALTETRLLPAKVRLFINFLQDSLSKKAIK